MSVKVKIVAYRAQTCPACGHTVSVLSRTPQHTEANEPTVATLKPGETGYIVPWNAGIGMDGVIYVIANSLTVPTKQGTAELPVTFSLDGKLGIDFTEELQNHLGTDRLRRAVSGTKLLPIDYYVGEPRVRSVARSLDNR